MTARKHQFIVTIILFIILLANLLNTQVALADGETPTEPPAATEVATEPPMESTPEPLEASPVPEEATVVPIEEVLTPVPESTEVIVLDDGGGAIPLATQEAVEIVEVFDPMWCPAGVLPGGAGCSTNFPSISALVTSMSTDPSSYNENGIIYFKETTGAETTGDSFALTIPSLGGGSFNTLNDFNLTLQGGWNGQNDVAATFAGQTNFGINSITIGETGATANRWVGNVTLNNFLFSWGNQPSVNIYTTGGSITLSNVDVLDHQGGTNTAILDSVAGSIGIENGSAFDGNGSDSNGFSARTAGTGSITVSDTSFTQVAQNGVANIYDGAWLSASTVTLTNVTARENDGNGIRIDNVNLVTLNNVIASNNGTNGYGSGVFINGFPGSRVIIIGGEFSRNQRSGVQVGKAANTTIYIQSMPVDCSGNPRGCYNVIPIFDSTPPKIIPTITGTAGANSWYRSDVSVSWSLTDAESGILSSSSGCSSVTLTAETSGTTITCSATNKAGLSASESVTVKIDKTGPILSTSNITAEATGTAGATVSYSASATDGMDGSVPVACSPVSGTVLPLGVTTVNCSATDTAGNTNNAAFLVTVQDTTAPSITPHADIIASAHLTTGKHVNYTSPSTFDVVDGASTASCLPASGSFFLLGPTEVTCTAIDSHGNSATNTFFIHVDRSDQSSTSESSSPAASVTLLTSGQAIALDCNSTFLAFGIKLSFTGLCDHQSNVHQVTANDLPAPLPDGSSIAVGLSVDVLNNGQLLEDMPEGASIQMDFPLVGGSKDNFAVLHWNGSGWVQIAQQNATDQTLSISTNQTGIFVLVKK